MLQSYINIKYSVALDISDLIMQVCFLQESIIFDVLEGNLKNWKFSRKYIPLGFKLFKDLKFNVKAGPP